MTTFGGYLTTADESVFSLYGQTVTYNGPDGGAGTSVTVVLGDIATETQTDEIGQRQFITTEGLITLADIATPDDAVNGTLVVGSDTWTISKVLDEDENSANYELWREEDNRRHSEQQKRRTV